MNVRWPTENALSANQVVRVSGTANSKVRAKITIKVIPSNVASNVYRFTTDDDGRFDQVLVVPDASGQRATLPEVLITVTVAGEDPVSQSYPYR